MELRARQREGTGRCPFCHDFLGPPELVQACPACNAVYHRPCARDLARCATMGCDGLSPLAPLAESILVRPVVTREGEALTGRSLGAPPHEQRAVPSPTWREARARTATRARWRSLARHVTAMAAPAVALLLIMAWDRSGGVLTVILLLCAVGLLLHALERRRQRR